jgi:cell division protein FtsQ
VLAIDSIVIEGNARVASDDVRRALDGLSGENIVLINLHDWRERLLKTPWIKEATVRRSLPSTVHVMVTEREPMAIGRFGNALYLVDAHGVVVDSFGPAYADLDLPIVEGLGTARTAIGATTDPPKAALASRVIAGVSAKPEIAMRVSQIDVRNPRNAALTLSGDSAVLYLGDEQFLARIESYLELAPRLREFVPDIDYVDLRFGDQVIVRPTKGGTAAVVKTSFVAPGSHAKRPKHPA